LSKLSIIFKEWRVMNRWILIRHLKQILEYLTSSYGNTILINLLMGGFYAGECHRISPLLKNNGPRLHYC
jgi:hypothetical protein